jgi:endonuclease/exonuclease/phosphatase family metal-dependent hydrolase
MVVSKDSIRIATYNIHKSRGLDRRVSPHRVVRVLRELDADIIALQEVVCVKGESPERDQGHFFATALSYYYCVGETRRLRGGTYGNVVLSRTPVRAAYNYDLSWRRLARRSCLRADVELSNGQLLHVFNVHLGLAFAERRYQARKLVSPSILTNVELHEPRVVLGDFNDWTRGLPSRLLATHFESVDVRHHLGRRRSYPGVLPLLHLDHIYFDRTLQLQRLTLHRTRTALIASDHVPLMAEFSLQPSL